MGVCSYCFQYVSWSDGGDCAGWDEARGCAGITGPDDPKYIAAKAKAQKADRERERQSLKKTIKSLRQDLKKATASLRALESQEQAGG